MQLPPLIILELAPEITDRFQRMWECLETIFSVSIVGPVQMTIGRDLCTIPLLNERFSIEVVLPSDNREYWILDLRSPDQPLLTLKRVTFKDEIFQRDQSQFLIRAMSVPFVKTAMSGEQWDEEMKKG
jgi:hypothetical protein